MSFAEAAAMPVIYQTSYLALNQRGRLQVGEWLLVLAAAGGVGSSAMQLGKAVGARVIAAVGNADKFDFCLQNGADHAIEPDLLMRYDTAETRRAVASVVAWRMLS